MEGYNSSQNFRRLGGVFFLSLLDIYEQSNGVLHGKPEQTVLEGDQAILEKVFLDTAVNETDRLPLFRTLPDELRKQSHPPTWWRMQLVMNQSKR